MEEVRNRKPMSETGSKMKRKQPSQPSRPPYRILRALFYLCIISLGSLSILVILNNTWPLKGQGHALNILDRISVALGVQEKTYAVVIDAGSTGSRVLAFTFCRALTDNGLKLDEELWHEVKPGLSSYADNPKEGAASLLPLLKLASEYVPEDKRLSTPLVLKATAGLRLLEDKKAEQLLREVASVLEQSGFYTNDNSIGIMDSKDEGIFSWFTVNYLMDRISGPIRETLVALDLGGGSTQIAFVPDRKETLDDVNEDDKSNINLFHKSVNIITKSYLGLGLMAGRSSILSAHADAEGVVHSPCINPIINVDWSYYERNFKVKGPAEPKYKTIRGQAGRLSEKRPIANFEECVKTCIKVIKAQVANAPKELESREVIAFSYFFDRSAERGLIDPYKGGVVTVQQLMQSARDTCDIPNAEQPFACMDLTFIGTFLSQGYGFLPETKMQLYKKINGHEVSWALGLAFHVVNNGL